VTKPQPQTYSLSRWFGRVAAAALLAVTASWSGSAQAVIVVSNGNDDGTGGTVNTLSWAILQANTTADDIRLDVDTTLTGPLVPQLNTATPITIIGQNHFVDGGGNQLFVVAGGTVNFSDMTIQNGAVTGGAGGTGAGGGGGGLGGGGAIFVKNGATVVVQPDVDFTGNSATGGAGGAGGAASGGGGGGGRNGGAGGNGDGATGGPGGTGDVGNGGSGGNPTGNINNPTDPTDGGFGTSGGGGGGAAQNGSVTSMPGTGSDGGGSGGEVNNGGDGGAGRGGAIYVEIGGNVIVVDSDVAPNTVTGGAGGAAGGGGSVGATGDASGNAIFVEGASTLTLSTATTQTVSGDISGGGLVVKQGAGTLVLTGTNSYTGGTSLQAGTIRGNTFGVQGDYFNNGLVTLTQNFTGTYGGNMSGTGGVNLTGTGTVIFTGTNTYTGGTTIDAGTLQGTTSSLTGTITNNSNLVFNQTFTGTYGGVITSTGGVTISGPGKVIFTGTNNYTGGTTIAGGTLEGNTTSLTGTMTNNGRLIFNQPTTGTFAGPITGTGNLVKQGAGTLVLTNTNTYSGGTTVASGTLEGTTASVQGNIVNDGVVRFNQATTGTYGGSMSGGGGVNLTGNGVYIFTGTNTYSGGTTVDNGELRGTTAGVQGNIVNNGEVTFHQGFTGAYSGSMSGAGAVNITGTGTVAFTGTNTYTGGTTVTGGTLQGTTSSLQGNILNNANVRFVNNTTGTFGGTISGTGGVNFNGTGTVAFGTDQTYTGNSNVQNGTLRLNASLTNDVIVAAPGTLAGNGFITGDVTLAGTMAPGNSIGTMTINGNYTTSAGSVQQIEIAAGGNTPGVHNDLITVNGNVTLSGGNVSVITPTSGGFGGGQKYTFLQHTGTRSGTFSGITTNSAFLNATLVYDPNAVAFLISRNSTNLRDVAETFNQRQVATYLDQNNMMASGDFLDVLDQVLTLDAAGARSAFDQLGGAIYGSAAQANFQNVTLMYNMLRRNVRNDDELGSPAFASDLADAGSFDSDIMLVGYSPDSRASIVPVQTTGMRRRRIWNAWTTTYGSGNESDDSIGFYGAGGTMASVYRNLDDAWKFGGFGAYNYVSLRSESPARQRTQQNSGQFGTYLRGDDGTNYLMWAMAMGFDNYESNRQIQFGNITRQASGDHEGYQYSSYFEFGRQFNLWPFDIEPFMALQYAYSRQNPFTETGAGGVNLQVGGIDADSLRSVLGSRLLWDVLTLAGKPVRPEMHIAWIHEFMDETTSFNSVFAGVGGTSFATQGTDFGRDWGLFGGGVNFAVTDRILLAAHYDMQTNDRSTVHLGSATMQVRW